MGGGGTARERVGVIDHEEQYACRTEVGALSGRLAGEAQARDQGTKGPFAKGRPAPGMVRLLRNRLPWQVRPDYDVNELRYKDSRRHGLHAPFDAHQVLAWFLLTMFTAVVTILHVPLLPTWPAITLGTFWVVCGGTLLCLYVWISLSDPADRMSKVKAEGISSYDILRADYPTTDGQQHLCTPPALQPCSHPESTPCDFCWALVDESSCPSPAVLPLWGLLSFALCLLVVRPAPREDCQPGPVCVYRTSCTVPCALCPASTARSATSVSWPSTTTADGSTLALVSILATAVLPALAPVHCVLLASRPQLPSVSLYCGLQMIVHILFGVYFAYHALAYADEYTTRVNEVYPIPDEASVVGPCLVAATCVVALAEGLV
eukprot:gene7149-1277_t